MRPDNIKLLDYSHEKQNLSGRIALFRATVVVAVERLPSRLVHVAYVLRISHIMQMRRTCSYVVRILVFEVAARSATPLRLGADHMQIPVVVYYRSFHNFLKKIGPALSQVRADKLLTQLKNK